MARATIKGTRQSVMNKRRKGFLAVFFPWLKRFGIAFGVFVGVLWLGAWMVMSGTLERSQNWMQQQVLMASADMGFVVENILVEGREYTDPQTLLAVLNIEKGDPLFSFDPKAAQELITQISWVDHVRIERRWPDTLYIGITERVPMALWQHDNQVKLLDQKGGVILTENLERFKGLKIVMGADAPEFSVELMENLSGEPALAARVLAARRLGERRWDLVLDNGLVVKLPEQDMALALSRLAREEQESGVLQRDILSIDMREEGRMTVQARPGAVQEYKASLVPESKKGNNI
jgi:cell division protein FtsQ